MKIGALTHPGLIRDKNEDYFLVIKDENGEAVNLIIADGMGGHNSGEVASFIASDYVAEFLKARLKQLNNKGLSLSELMVEAIKGANRQVYEAAQESSSNTGMGTTLSTALICNDQVKMAHVGDSRIYLYRENNLRQITTDHSYIEELLQSGSITKDEARTHPRRNIITRALGSEDDVIPDLFDLSLLQGDIILLCTDGLTNMLEDQEISAVLSLEMEVEDTCRRLVDLANEKGGEDNVTVIVARY